MNIDEAKQEIPTIDSFADELCAYCHNDWYCSFWCETLRKAEKMFDRVQQAYARYDGDIVKVDRYIKRAKY